MKFYPMKKKGGGGGSENVLAMANTLTYAC